MNEPIHDEDSLFIRKGSISFLLRIWQAQVKDKTQWYLSLEDPSTRELFTFQNLNTFTHYLTQLMHKKQAKE
jgi:hypothetical protein